MSDLKKKTAAGAIWAMLDRAGQEIVRFTVFLVMAWILAVEDIALIGMLTIFTALSSLLIDGGFVTTLIRRKEVSDIDYSTIFVFNIFISLFLYIIIFFSAPFIASFYNQPRLIGIIRFLFLTLPINALGFIQSIQIVRRLHFKVSSIIGFVALCIASAIAVVSAFMGAGVWALAVQTVMFAAIRVSLLWRYNSWKVSFRFSRSVFFEHFRFSRHLLASGMLNVIFNHVYALIIGKFFSNLQMGYYTQSHKIANVPHSALSGSIQGVSLAAFSQVQDNEERFIRAARKSMRTLAFLLLPIMMGLICVAHPFILALLGKKWENMSLFFQLLCCANIFNSLSTLNYTFSNIKGFSKLVFRMDVLKIALLALMLPAVITVSFDVVNMLYGLIAVNVLHFFINSYFIGRKTGYSLLMQLKDIFPYLLTSLVMFAAAYVWIFVVENNVVLIVVQTITGLLVYIGLNERLGSKVYKDTKEIALKQIKSMIRI